MPIGVGIIGTGFGLRALLPAFERTGRARVVALAGSTAARAAELGAPHGIPLLTGDVHELCAAPAVDLVVVASPNDLHVEHAEAALGAGKHLYLEKPAGVNAVETRRFAALALEADRLVVLGHSLRLDPRVRRLRDLIAAGSIGPVSLVSMVQCGSSLVRERRSPGWQLRQERGGGVRLGTGSHMFDLVRFLLGENAESVSAATVSIDGGADTCFSALVRYPGFVADLVTNAAAHVQPRFDVVVHGDRGDLTLAADRTLLLHRAGEHPEDVGSDCDAGDRGTGLFDVALTYLVDAVVAALVEGRTEIDGIATPADAVRCLEELDAALLSSNTGGQAVRVAA
jgi:predicted dehydrogenase